MSINSQIYGKSIFKLFPCLSKRPLCVALAGLCQWAPNLVTGSSPSLLWINWTAFMKEVRGGTLHPTQLKKGVLFFTTGHPLMQASIKHPVTFTVITHVYAFCRIAFEKKKKGCDLIYPMLNFLIL